MHASLRSDAAYEILDAGALVAGSPPLNNNLFPTMAAVLTYLKGLRPQNLAGAAFGSYGWSGEAAGQINDILAEMKVDPAAEPLRVKYVPDGDDLKRCCRTRQDRDAQTQGGYNTWIMQWIRKRSGIFPMACMWSHRLRETEERTDRQFDHTGLRGDAADRREHQQGKSDPRVHPEERRARRHRSRAGNAHDLYRSVRFQERQGRGQV